MKVARALLIALTFSLGVAGCGQVSQPESPVAKPDKVLTSEIPAKQAPSIGAASRYATGIDVGNLRSERRVFVFFDPQCPHCGAFWKETKKLGNDARFTWVPVAILNRTSLAQGAAILGAASPVETMNAHEVKLTAGAGGMSAPEAAPKYKELIERNTKLLESFGATGVPFILSVHEKTGQVYLNSAGMPAEKLAAALGWPPAEADSQPNKAAHWQGDAPY